MQCPECGAALIAGETFCRACGVSLDDDSTEVAALGQELLEVTRQLRELQEKASELRNRMGELLPADRALSFPLGQIRWRQMPASKWMRRGDVLAFMQREFGDVVSERVDAECSRERPPSRQLFIKLQTPEKTGSDTNF
jgi:uncharacterized Zn finger protein (UPF0148 family)